MGLLREHLCKSVLATKKHGFAVHAHCGIPRSFIGQMEHSWCPCLNADPGIIYQTIGRISLDMLHPRGVGSYMSSLPYSLTAA